MTAIQLIAGTKIYRPARVVKTGPEAWAYEVIIETPSMEHFGDGTVMVRAAPHAALAPDWVVVPWEAKGKRVCVCDEPVPEDWTHFAVLFADVNFVAVTPVAGGVEELRRRHLEAFGLAQKNEA